MCSKASTANVFSLVSHFCLCSSPNPVCGDFCHLSFDFCYFCSIFFTFMGGGEEMVCIDHFRGREKELFCYLKSLAQSLPLSAFNMPYFFMLSWRRRGRAIFNDSFNNLNFFQLHRNLCSIYLILPSSQDGENAPLLIRRKASWSSVYSKEPWDALTVT